MRHTHKFYTGAQNLLKKVESSPRGRENGNYTGKVMSYRKVMGKNYLIHAEEATAIKTVSLTANCDNGELKMFKMKLQLDKATLLQVHKKENK